jgi:hypothetical protein
LIWIKAPALAPASMQGGDGILYLRHQIARSTAREIEMTRHRKSLTVTGAACAAVLSLAFVSFDSKPAHAIVYCSYVGYPSGCVARAGVALGVRPVARAAVRHNAGGNANGGVNRVGARR